MGVLTGGLCFWSVFRLEFVFTEAAFFGDALFEVPLRVEAVRFFVGFFFGTLFLVVRFFTDGFFLDFCFFPAVRFFGAPFPAVFFFAGDFFETVDARELDFGTERAADFAGYERVGRRGEGLMGDFGDPVHQ